MSPADKIKLKQRIEVKQQRCRLPNWYMADADCKYSLTNSVSLLGLLDQEGVLLWLVSDWTDR